MGETKTFQICYEGELTAEIARAIRRLGGEANFDSSWHLPLSERRHAAVVLRALRNLLPPDGNLLVARTQHTRSRDFLLVRHSSSEGADYDRLHSAVAKLGYAVELPFRSTFVVESRDRSDLRLIGERLSATCPDDSLMVIGISHDFAYCSSGVSRMFLPFGQLSEGRQFRDF
jgi:hypothetical protein